MLRAIDRSPAPRDSREKVHTDLRHVTLHGTDSARAGRKFFKARARRRSARERCRACTARLTLARVLASLGSECANTVYKLPHLRIRVIASGTVRRCAERLTPSVQAHPEVGTPDGCGSPLPGRTMPPAPRPRVRAARATGLSFLRGLVCEPEVVVSHIPFARAVFLRRRLRATRRQRGRVVPDLGLRTEA